jgi:hypothetical protein
VKIEKLRRDLVGRHSPRLLVAQSLQELGTRLEPHPFASLDLCD